MVTWLMHRTSDPHSIISAFIFVDIAANSTLAMVCRRRAPGPMPRFLTYAWPDLASDSILHDVVSTIPLDIEGGSCPGDRRIWMDEGCVGPIRETRQLHPGDAEALSLGLL